MAASHSEVQDIDRQVMERVDGVVYSGHCTGDKASGSLAGVMGDRLRAFPTGTVVEV